MDSGQFDALTRRLGVAITRRGTLGALLAGIAAFVLPGAAPPGPAAAAQRGRAKGKGKGKDRRRGGSGPGRGNKRGQTRDADRRARARAEAIRCCSTGKCTPGKGKNLQKCCYKNQDLTGKNFQGANLGSANFAGATLTNANVQAANLGKACFVDANLTGIRTNASTNWGGTVLCRTRTTGGEDNSGCGRGTPCCPTCDANRPCDDDEVCCAGRCIPGNCCDNNEQSTCDDNQICCGNRCVAGECCQAADCPNRTCQRRACAANRCAYTPVIGEPGPRCQTICCEDGQGDPACCAAGVTTCQANGRCSCTGDDACGADERCCAGTCIPRSRCCDGDNPEGCSGDLHCCVRDGTGVCRECCDADQCPDETCETKRCGADGTCAYDPVFGDDAPPGCTTICCENADEQPVCCPDGTTVCTASRRCRCAGDADCASDQFCCNGTCIADTRCCNNDPSTCPAVGICQERACADGACQPRGLTGGTCPFSSGGTGECRDGSCICPSPRIVCSNGCCPVGATACKADGTCGPGCDVCPSGCPFTSLAAAVVGTPANGTIRICPGTYPTNSVSIQKNLTIVGAGAGSDPTVDTILSGGNTSGVLSIVAAAVTIQDLTVTEGKGADRCGGVEVVFDATLNLERAEIVGNTSNIAPTGPNAGGGLMVFDGSTVVIKASRIANNTAQGGPSAVGGGIFNDGTLTLEATRVELNTALSGSGITNAGKLTLNPGAVVTMNTATNPSLPLGSGIYNVGTIIDNDPGTNVFGNIPSTFNGVPNNCINEPPGTGCPA